MMKGLVKWIILAIILIVCIPIVSAFTVTGVTINPSGSLTPGTPVTVSLQVEFSASSGETFPSGDDLQFITDLTSPQWTYTIVLDGVDNPRPQSTSRSLDLSGFELSYPSTVDESLQITLQGTAPSVDQTTNKTIITVQENDQNGNLIASSVFTQTTMVINVNDVATAISGIKNKLTTFRSNIDEKAAMGIDTSAAESKYSEASSDINAAAALPSTQYSAALNDLTAAQTAIDAGGNALDLAWANEEVAAAQTPITNADAVIAWFKGNQTTADDPQLGAIIAMREVAVGYISSANDFITNGQYDQARAKAEAAFTEGNQSYTNALQRQYTLMHSGIDIGGMISGIFKSGVLVVVVGIVVVVLIGVGIVVYRKRSRWDELG
ncbi:MAG: hypothetical protein ABSB80_05380 [Methanoregula sp.]|jgi:hypothetical protein|uniref:hypothetical protein n=1 Tax=Methanoregula sp. TaxID=2052170 RepID=UPI003D113D31